MTLREHTSLNPIAPTQTADLNVISKLWKVLLDRVLIHLSEGHLKIVLPNGQTLRYGAANKNQPTVTVKIVRAKLLWRLLSGNSLSLAEGYLEEDWQCHDLRAYLIC